MDSNVAATVYKNIENVVNLPSYTVVIQMNKDNYSFELLTNYVFIAGSKEAALKMAGSLVTKLIPYVEVGYDIKHQKMTVHIEDNKYFDYVTFRNFEIYDEAQVELYSSLNSGIQTNVVNQSCYLYVSEKAFHEHLHKNYNKTVQNSLKFEALGYGITVLD